MAVTDTPFVAAGVNPSNFSQLVDIARYMPDNELDRYVKALRRHLAIIQAQAADSDPNLSFRWEGDNDDLEKILSEIEHEHLY